MGGLISQSNNGSWSQHYVINRFCRLFRTFGIFSPAPLTARLTQMSDSASTREGLLDLLLPVFRERGYEGASLAALASASGRGKASLYHHFPGGKSEIVANLVRRCVKELDQQVFGPLSGSAAPIQRLEQSIDGFALYTEQGKHNCLLATLAGTNPEQLDPAVAERFRHWQEQLGQTLEELGLRPKAAAHQARNVLSRLYGALVLDRLSDQRTNLRQTQKRLKKELQQFAKQRAK